jgi:hypothetical protein
MGPLRLKQGNKGHDLIKQGHDHERTRHIATGFFFVKNRIETKEVVLEYFRTEEMIVNVMTKPLQLRPFRRMRGLLLNSGH